ncbi:hypothetical protein HMPREF9374_3844 [Desmospora sp. 8437]|nr:hypothetical protein HMPREF9374_3844 [Desmospora sp. 8437]
MGFKSRPSSDEGSSVKEAFEGFYNQKVGNELKTLEELEDKLKDFK